MAETKAGSSITAVVFDFDGTIMDTNGVIIESWQHTYRTLTGREGNLDYILATFGEPLELSMRNAFPDIPVDKSVDVYRTWHRENFGPMISLFPGIKELLEELKRRGYKMGIATSRVKKTLYQGLRKYDIEKYFDEIVTVEEVSKHKPDPESLLKVLKKLDVEPENAIMVGDSRLDIICARNAGVEAVLVEWSASLAGKSMEDFPRDEAPDHIISEADDLLKLL